MSKGMADVGPDDSNLRENVLEFLCQRQQGAVVVHSLYAALRKAYGASTSAIEGALAALEADGAVMVRDHYCADPHLEGVDLRVVALVEPGAGEDAQWRSIRAIEDIWNERLTTYLAQHRCV